MFNGHLSEIIHQKNFQALIGRTASEFPWVPICTHRYTHMYKHHTLIKPTLCSDTSHQHEPLLFSSSLQCHLPLPAILHSCLKTSLNKLEVRTHQGWTTANNCALVSTKVTIKVSLTVQMYKKIHVICQKKRKVLHLHLTCLGFALHTQTSPLTTEEYTNIELCKCLRAKARA